MSSVSLGDLAQMTAESLQRSHLSAIVDKQIEIDPTGPFIKDGTSIFSKIRFSWRTEDRLVLEQIKGAAQAVFDEQFSDAIMLLDDFTSKVRGPDGRENWDKLTGDEIFVRTGSGPSPTPYGNRLIKASQKVMAEANACFSEMELFDPQVHKRTFRIGLQDFLEAAFLPKLMKRFQSFSHVDIRVIPYKLDSAAQDLETGKLDLIVDVRPIDSEEHSSEILLEDEVCIALRRRHPLAEKSSLSTEDFDQLEYVIVRPHQIEFHSAELTLRQMGIHRKVAIETSAPMIVPQIVAETDFASTMPRRLFSGAIAAYKLKTHSMPFEFPPMRLMMVSAGSLRFDPGIRWLKEQFKLLV